MKKKSEKKENVKKGRKFLKAYFVVAIIFALLGLLEYFMLQDISPNSAAYLLYALFTCLIVIGVLALSIIAIVIFAKNKLPKITWVLPIYYLVILVGSFLVGFVFAAITVDFTAVSNFLSIFGLISSIFELVFSIYMLYRFK